MEDFIIAEEYTLPSKGLVYSKSVNPDIKIRSMTTQEEMKRLGHSDVPYKMLSEIIDDCLVTKPGISSYDMCIGDYQFLFYKLRIVTYGEDYKINATCPLCKCVSEHNINLEELEVSECPDNYEDYLNITLPRSGKKVKLRMQTPRSLDEVNKKSRELTSKNPSMKGDPAFLLTLESVIESVDGEILNPVQLTTFIRNLPAADSNYILKSLDKLMIGINPIITLICPKCGQEYKQVLPITGEFFGPAID